MRKYLAGLLVLGILSASAWAYPSKKDEVKQPSDPESQAEEIHRIASSDMIYTQEESKALYYQNQKIIELLKEIRDLLRQQEK